MHDGSVSWRSAAHPVPFAAVSLGAIPAASRTVLALGLILLAVVTSGAARAQTPRALTVSDLFAIESVRGVSWNATGTHAAIEVQAPGDDLDARELRSRVLIWDDGAARALSPHGSTAAHDELAIWGASWSPDGGALALLIAGPEAAVQLAVWRVDSGLHAVPGVDVRLDIGGDPVHWVDNDTLLVTAWPTGADRSGRLYFRRMRGMRNASLWAARRNGQTSATVLDTHDATGVDPAPQPTALTRVRLDTVAPSGVHTEVVATDRMHRPSVAPGGRHVAYFTPSPGIPTESVASLLRHEELYSPVNWGTAVTIVDLDTGVAVAGPQPLLDPDHEALRWSADGTRLTARGSHPAGEEPGRTLRWEGAALDWVPEEPVAHTPEEPAEPAVAATTPAPRPPSENAVLVAAAGDGGAAMYLERDETGHRLVRVGANPGDEPASPAPVVVWEGNTWVGDIGIPAAHRLDYTSESGQQLIGWLLKPPGSGPFPLVTSVYPGTVYGETAPRALTTISADFTSPLLFAARGYAVLLPSMPEGRSANDHPIDELTDGVLPAVDAALATGLIDPERLAVQGQSGGGYAVLGLIGRTDRFRAAIASASYSDLESLYGTFYGQMRYGDGGHPQSGQVLRITQMERGFLRMGGPPWELAERYRYNSPITHLESMRTPLLLIHGDLDFIPIQQAEQMFTSLYRLGRDVRFLRYHGEWHTVASRANVEHLWTEIDRWLIRQLPGARTPDLTR